MYQPHVVGLRMTVTSALIHTRMYSCF